MKKRIAAAFPALIAAFALAVPSAARAQGLSPYYNLNDAGAVLSAGVVPGSVILTPDEMVQEAFRYCVASGLDSASAFWMVKANLNEIAFASPATPERVQELVRNEMTAANTLAHASAVPAEGRNGAPGARAEQECVQRAFASLVAGGMSPTDAYNFVKDNLTVILAAGGF